MVENFCRDEANLWFGKLYNSWMYSEASLTIFSSKILAIWFEFTILLTLLRENDGILNESVQKLWTILPTATFFSRRVISLEKVVFSCSWNLGGVSLPCSGALAEALFAGPFWPHLTLLRGTAGPEGVTGVWLVGGGGGGRGLGGAALVVLVADGAVAADDAVRPVTLLEKLFKQPLLQLSNDW